MSALNIAQAAYLHELGKRKANQDNIYPLAGQATIADRLFMVCDGVGGSQRGDVASHLACKFFPEFFQRNKNQIDESYLEQALRYTEDKLIAFARENPDTEKMQTTLTLLHIGEKECAIGWVGDSRVYHVSKGEVRFRSKDHSLVQTLIDNKEITEEQARTHPQKNLILRGVSGTGERSKMDTHFISAEEIQDGDYFFLCTDGVIESVHDNDLKNWMDSSKTPAEIAGLVKQKCQSNSNDNFSCYVIKVKLSEAGKKSTPVPVGTPVSQVAKSATATETPKAGISGKEKKLFLIGGGILLTLLVIFLFVYTNGNSEKSKSEEVPQQENASQQQEPVPQEESNREPEGSEVKTIESESESESATASSIQTEEEQEEAKPAKKEKLVVAESKKENKSSPPPAPPKEPAKKANPKPVEKIPEEQRELKSGPVTDYKYPSGNRYTGNLVDGKKEGKGTLIYADGGKYIGIFVNDMRQDERATFSFPNKTKYVGPFSKDQINGYGKLYNEDGSEQYSGNWKDNQMNGRGTLTTAEGTCIGSFVNGKISDCKFTFKSGDVYNGKFKDGMFEDVQGIYTWKDGSVCKGNFVKGEKSGKCDCTYASGTIKKYTGDWLNDKKHGQGTADYQNGERYVGPWLNDKREGCGELQEKIEGVWKTMKKVIWAEDRSTDTRCK